MAAPSSSRRVLVVGAGPSGLVAIKEARVAGLTPVCYEAQGWIGGLWRFTDHESHSSVYRSTVINTSKEMMCFSDFIPPKEFPNFMHHSYCVRYFEMYADHFNLRSHIQLNRRVLHVDKADDYAATGRYRVVSQVGQQAPVTEIFDLVMVCTGHHWRPKTPKFAGLSTFAGKQMHSHSYKDYRGFENLNVLVIGVGNSGLDIAVELSRHAKQTYLSTRSGTWLATRQGYKGMPSDYVSIRRAFMDLVVDGVVEEQLQRKVDLRLYGLQPKHHFNQAHPSINDDLIGRINTGALSVRPNVREFRATSVVFEDGKEDAIDAVVFATGYDIAFPFLEKTCGIQVQSNKVDLYKYMFPPDNAHPTLCVIGLFQALGALMPICEVQCRLATAVFTGKKSLPSVAEMYADIHEKRAAVEARYIASERHTIQVDYPHYSDELARMVGCMPDMDHLRAVDPELAEVVWTKGAVPAHYRLMGPDRWEGAREAVMDAEYRIVYALSGGRVPDFIRRGAQSRL